MNAASIVRAGASMAAAATLLSCSRQPDRPPNPDAPPVDVASFMARRDGCDALLRYRPSRDEDLRELKRQRSEMCRGLDAEMTILRRDYAHDHRALRVLDRYRPLGLEE